MDREPLDMEPIGPHADFCPMRRPATWRAAYDRFASCACSNVVLGKLLRKAY
jgi:hypothetical protein